MISDEELLSRDQQWLTRDQQWRYISHICDRIRDRTVTPDEMKFLHEHADPMLLNTMIQYICQRNAGIIGEHEHPIIHRTTSGF